jgi:glutamyl-tRNA reductase
VTLGEAGMTLFLLGVNHRTATLEDREALALSPAEVLDSLGRIARRGVLREALVLSTCNRTEFYAVAAEITAAEREVRSVVEQLRRSDLLAPGPHRYLLSGPAVCTHLLRVGCGLDSMVLGDVQILGQVKEAYALARRAGTADVLLDRLLETALHAGKRARSETAIGAGHVSMSSSAVAAAVDTVGLRGRRVLVVGAGETARLAARHAADHDPVAVVIANRTIARAEALAREVGGRTVTLDGIAEAIADADVVFSATSAPCTVISAEVIRAAIATRPGRPLLVLDLAIPRDVEPAAAAIPGVTLRTLDTIRASVDQSLSTRSAEVPQVEAIVAEEAERFVHWTRGLAATPTLVALREHFERIRIEEVERLWRHASDDERERAERLTRVLVNRLLHVPMLRLKETDAASADGQMRLQAARDLFALGASFDSGRRHDA